MKRNLQLLLCLLMAVFFTGLSGHATVPVKAGFNENDLLLSLPVLEQMNADGGYDSKRETQPTTREAEYNYGSFYLVWLGSESTRLYPLESVDGSDTKFVIRNFAVHKGDRFTMQSSEIGVVLGAIAVDPVSEENLTCVLASYTDGGMYYGVCNLNAYYDIWIEFEGLKATLTFEKVGEIAFNAADTILSVYGGFSVKPSEAEGNHLVWKSVPFQGERAFLFRNTSNGEMYAVLEEGIGISETSPSIMVYTNPEFYIDFDGEDAQYDISFDYSSDYASAKVTFSKAVIPEGVANYSGDLYLYGTATNDTMGSEEYKLTCVEPGLYEWRGDMLGSGFMINSGQNQTVYFPDTNMPISLGAIKYDEIANNGINFVPDSKMLLQFGGAQFNFFNPLYVLNNAVVKVNLKDLTITLNGELGCPQIALENIMMFTYPGYTSYSPEVKDGEILYKNVECTDISVMTLYIGSINFGLNADDESKLSPDNLKVNIVASDMASVKSIPVELTGKYDVYVKFNEETTQGELRVVESVPDSPSGIQDGITMDVTEVDVYSIDGSLVVKSGIKDAVKQLAPGVYVIRQGCKSEKISVK